MRLSGLRVRVILLLIIVVGIGVIIRQTSFIFSYNIHNNYVEKELESIKGNEDFLSDHNPQVLILYDEENKSYRDNAVDFLSQIRMDYDVLEAEVYNNASDKYPVIFIAIENFESVGNNNELFKYVENGGRLFFLKRLDLTSGFYDHYQKLGITEFTSLIDVEAISLNQSYLKGFEKRNYSGDFFWNSSLIVQLLKDVQVYVTSDMEVPLMWKRHYGLGEIIYFNGTMLSDRGHQVIFLEDLLEGIEPFIYPIANVKLITIGEFPAPLYDGESKIIMDYFSRNNNNFYREIWWPDMLSLGKRFDLNYSTATLINYDENRKNEESLSKEDYIYYAREVLNQKGELGYQEIDFIKESGAHTEYLPHYQYNQYVPPSGLLTKEVLSYIDENPEKVPIVTGLFRTGNPEYYQQSFGQRASRVVEIPIISKGYELDDTNEWLMMSALKIQGIYHHYLSGNVLTTTDWEKSYDAYNRHHRWLKQNYPDLNSLTATDAVEDIVLYAREDYTLNQSNGTWVLRSSHLGVKYFYFYTDKKITNVVGGTFKELPEGGYLLEMDNEVCVLEWSRL